LTHAPEHSPSLAQFFLVQPEPPQTKFGGQLVELHALGTQCPVPTSHVSRPAGAVSQLASLVQRGVHWGGLQVGVTQTRFAPASAQLASVVHVAAACAGPPQTVWPGATHCSND
jgi:hypothetical protein